MVVYQDKMYLGLESCRVQVYDLDTLTLIRTLETPDSEGEDAPAAPANGDLAGEHLPRSCKLAHHNKTLAVNNANRNKVRLYNCDTDDLVGVIETRGADGSRAGPIYNMTMNDRLLVCLAGWSSLSWRIESGRPDTVRSRFMGICPDFEPSDAYQNYLEVHSGVINQAWVYIFEDSQMGGVKDKS